MNENKTSDKSMNDSLYNLKPKSFIKRVLDYFFQGLLYIAPIGVTLYIIYLIFNVIDKFIQTNAMSFLPFRIPGLGLIVMFIFISLLGYFGQNLFTRPMKVLFEKLLRKAPIVQILYSSIKDFLSAFVGKERKFNQPVLVVINAENHLEKLGFVTQNDLSHLGMQDKVAVYFPHSYNFSGELYLVPASNVTPIDISPAEVMKFIVSGGVTKA